MEACGGYVEAVEDLVRGLSTLSINAREGVSDALTKIGVLCARGLIELSFLSEPDTSKDEISKPDKGNSSSDDSDSSSESETSPSKAGADVKSKNVDDNSPSSDSDSKTSNASSSKNGAQDTNDQQTTLNSDASDSQTCTPNVTRRNIRDECPFFPVIRRKGRTKAGEPPADTRAIYYLPSTASPWEGRWDEFHAPPRAKSNKKVTGLANKCYVINNEGQSQLEMILQETQQHVPDKARHPFTCDQHPEEMGTAALQVWYFRQEFEKRTSTSTLHMSGLAGATNSRTSS